MAQHTNCAALRHPDDKPTIDIILCKAKSKTIAEYAVRSINQPIGVSTYQSQDTLPEQLQQSLPTIEQLEAELNTVIIKTEDKEN